LEPIPLGTPSERKERQSKSSLPVSQAPCMTQRKLPAAKGATRGDTLERSRTLREGTTSGRETTGVTTSQPVATSAKASSSKQIESGSSSLAKSRETGFRTKAGRAKATMVTSSNSTMGATTGGGTLIKGGDIIPAVAMGRSNTEAGDRTTTEAEVATTIRNSTSKGQSRSTSTFRRGRAIKYPKSLKMPLPLVARNLNHFI